MSNEYSLIIKFWIIIFSLVDYTPQKSALVSCVFWSFSIPGIVLVVQVYRYTPKDTLEIAQLITRSPSQHSDIATKFRFTKVGDACPLKQQKVPSSRFHFIPCRTYSYMQSVCGKDH